MGISLDSS
jgi:hypothetical protein